MPLACLARAVSDPATGLAGLLLLWRSLPLGGMLALCRTQEKRAGSSSAEFHRKLVLSESHRTL